MEGEESFTGIKVDEILADFFVRKYDGKLIESEDSSVSSNHSSGSKSENKKSRKKKKKHKSKEKKHKYSSKRTSRSPKRSEKHQSRSSNSYERGRSRSPRHAHRHRSRTPRSRSHRSRSPKYSERHKSRSPRHSSSKHKSRSPRRSRGYRSRSTSYSDRSKSPRHKDRSYSHRASPHESKSPEKNQIKISSDVTKCKKEEMKQIKDDRNSNKEACTTAEDLKSMVSINLGADRSSKTESMSYNKDSNTINASAPQDRCSPLKNMDSVLKNGTELQLCNYNSCYIESNHIVGADPQNSVTGKSETLSVHNNSSSNGQHVTKLIGGGLLGDTKGSSGDAMKLELCEASCVGNKLSDKVSKDSNFDQVATDKYTVLVNKVQVSEMSVSISKTILESDADADNSNSNLENSSQTKAKIVFKDLKCSSFAKTLNSCDNIDLPKECKSSQSSDSASVSVNRTDNVHEKESLQGSSTAEKRYRSPSESSDKSSGSDRKSNPQEKKKRKHSKDKKRKHNKEKKHKRKKKSQSKERSVSPRKSDGREKFDKVKLLNVARRNVLSMLEKGTLPQGISVENLRHEQLISIKAGGKSVRELTEFCQALSKKEEEDDDDDNKKEDTKNGEDSDHPFMHHPFKLREQAVITMNIKNATQLPVKTHAEKVAENARLSLQFPVSSGSQHRQKEMEWVPVEKDDKKTSPTSEKKMTLKPSVKEGKKTVESVVPIITKPETKPALPAPVNESVNIIPPPSPLTQQLPLPPPPLPPPPSSSFAVSSLMPSSFPVPVSFHPSGTDAAVNLASVSTSGTGQMFQTSAVQALTSPYGMSSGYVHSASPSPPVMNSFPTLSAKNIDLSAVVADRLKAVRKLQENPNDPEGLSLLHQSEQKLQAWVQSQQVPGKFTGSTDAKLLSAHELSGPNPVWAKKDSLFRAAPVTEGKGMSLMKKMGWNPGEGLGKNKEGTLEPLVLDIKMDKKGLVSEGEEQKKRLTIAYCHKHPVSVLAELCSKRKWSPPIYTVISETGPSHRRLFLFKVNVNDVEYQPKSSSPNKKLAKAQAAVLCLNAMGVTASEYIMPS